jgi:hypothetical protein
MPGGPSMTSTPPRPCTSAVTTAPITFNSPARPRIGGVTSRWPPTSNRPVEGRTRCPVYRLLDCHCSARHCRHPPITAEYNGDVARRARHPGQRLGTDSQIYDRAGKQNRQFVGALVEHLHHFSDPFLHLVAWHAPKDQAQASAMPLSARNKDARHRRRWAMTGALRRLVGRNYGGARSRHRWRRWWVSLELRASFLNALYTVLASMPRRGPIASSDRPSA